MLFAQILATAIFLMMFFLVITEVVERQWVTLGCGLLTLLLVFGLGLHSWEAVMKTLNVRSIFTLGFWIASAGEGESSSGINWATIIFIAGMMVMVEGMARVGFFRWLCMLLAKTVPIIKKKLFYSPRGVLIDYNDKELLEEFTKEIKKFLKEKNGFLLKIDPYVEYQERDNDGKVVENGYNNKFTCK